MPPTHELRLRVRYSETDQMGVVHHAAYLVWLEEGRTALMRDSGIPYDEIERSGFAMGVRKVDVRYRRAAAYGDQIVVETALDQVRGASIRFATTLRRLADDAVLATAKVEVACMALPDLKPAPLPEPIRRALAAFEAGPQAPIGSSSSTSTGA